MRAISALFALAAFSAWGQDDPLQTGIAAFHRGQYAAAIASLDKAPDSAARRTFQALARAGYGQCDAAQPELAEQFEKNDDAALRRLAGLALAQCYLAAGRFDQALPVVTRLKALFPGDADVLYEAARLHMKAWNDT